MKKVVSVIGKPFRLIGRLLLMIGRLLLKILGSLRFLGKPFIKLSKLRGKKLVIALVPIVIVLVVLVSVLQPEPDREDEVRETLDRYAEATREKDYQALCDDLLASDLVERIRNAGLPCEVALRTGLEGRQNPTLTVLSVEVNGDEALARLRGTAVGEPTGTSTYRLVREDDNWHISTSPGSAGQSPGVGP